MKGIAVFFFFPLSSTHGSPSSPFSFLFPILSFFIFFSFPTGLFGLLQVRESFLSLYCSSCHVSHFPWSKCHMDTCSRWHSPHHMALMSCVLLPWCHVAVPGYAVWHHPMCHATPDTSKNMKFRSSRNSNKFDWVTRFHETNSTVKSVSSSKIYKIFIFSTCILAANYRFAIFQKN